MALPSLVKYVLHWSGLGEEGQTGWYVAPSGGIDHAGLQAAADGMAGKFAADNSWGQELRKWLGVYQAFDKISVYNYPTGNSPAADVAESPIAPSRGQGQGMNFHPLQAAVCVTLHTGRPGASYRGRLYLPATGIQMPAHRFLQADLDRLASQIGGDSAGLTDNIDGMLWDSERELAQGSAGAGTAVVRSVAKHLATAIKSVSVDDIPDTQRRRAQSLTPTYRANHTMDRPIGTFGTFPVGP